MRLSYTQFKTAFGLSKLSITDYVNVVYNEASKIEEVGCYVVDKSKLQKSTSTTDDSQVYYVTYTNLPADFKYIGLRLNSGIYTQNFKTISDGRIFRDTHAFDIYETWFTTVTNKSIGFNLPKDWSENECKNYLNGIKIFYKKAYISLNWISKIDGKFYYKDTGLIGDSTTPEASAKLADISKYVGKKIEFKRTVGTTVAGNVFFDKENTYISGVYYQADTLQEVTIPSNAKYFGFSYYADVTIIPRIKV